MTSSPQLLLDPVSDLRQLVQFPFMVNALEAGTIVAVLAAVVGWYMVLRRQSFAGHTLSVMAFPGATGAALAGLPAALGYYLACAGAALAIGSSGRVLTTGYSSETAAIGTVQSVGLAAGFLFLSLNHAVLGGP
jgi:zinc/manganese transport system permease protein